MGLDFLKQEQKSFKEIIKRIIRRDFSGYTGIAIKNSTYQVATTIVAKVGSLIFVMIIARLLMPELFGLYSLALSTLVLFSAFSDMGIGGSLILFVSKSLAKNNESLAKSYAVYLAKLKSFLVLGIALILAFSAGFISNTYYNKPIYLALIAGILYILFLDAGRYLSLLFDSVNNFRYSMYKEAIFQIFRLILVPLVIIASLKLSLPHEQLLFFIIISLALSYLISSIFLFISAGKKIKFLHSKAQALNKGLKTDVNKFILMLSLTVLSGMFFANIDILMLGHFVIAEFIGYYQAAISLIFSIIAVTAISAAILPVFSRLEGPRLEKAFKKSRNVILILSVFLSIMSCLLAPVFIRVIFGSEYASATPLVRLFSLIILSFPLASIYESYFIARSKPMFINILLMVSTAMNIILNYILISTLVRQSQYLALFGAAIATIISRYCYVGLMVLTRRTVVVRH